jgi:uncharacterized protein YlzI (FlbEa/FlbD family)
MKRFRVYRLGHLVLTVTLRNNNLRLEGNPHLIESLEKDGVLDLTSGRNLTVKNHLESENASLIFEALCGHFQRASAYSIELDT